MSARLSPSSFRQWWLAGLLLLGCLWRMEAIEPAATPAAKKFDVEALAKLIPSDAKVKRGGKPNLAGMVQANQALNEMAVNKMATQVIRVLTVNPAGANLQVVAMPIRLSVGGTSIDCFVYTYLPSDKVDPHQRITKNNRLTVTGKVSRAAIETRENEPVLSIDLTEAQVEEK